MKPQSACLTIVLLAGAVIMAGCISTSRDESGVPSPTSTPTAPDSGATSPPATTTTLTPEEDPQPTSAPAPANNGDLEIPHYEFPSGDQEIYRLHLESGEQTRVTEDQRQYLFPVWSPDGERIAAVVENRDRPDTSIIVMDRDGGNAHELATGAERGRIAWSPDGSTLAYASREPGEIALIDPDGTSPHQLTHQDPVEPGDRYFSVTSPAWSPDGSRIVFSAMQSPRDDAPVGVAELWTVDVNGDGTAKKLTDSPELQKFDPVWLPHGDRIAFSGYDADSGATRLYTVDRHGEDLQDYALAGNNAREPHWSPDNTRVVFTQERSHIEDIFVANAIGTGIEQLTDGDHSNNSPRWSPDGSEILFISNRDPRLAEPCSYGVDFDLGETPSFEHLAWTSTQVVTGTITEKHDAQFAEPHWFAHGPCLEIVTEYTLKVETRYRGFESDRLTIRVPGGTIGQYEAQIGNTPSYEPGDRVIIFLFDAPESEMLPDAYGVDGQRSWQVSDDDVIRKNSQLDQFVGVDLTELEGRIVATLTSEPPQSVGSNAVPLDEAPVPE